MEIRSHGIKITAEEGRSIQGAPSSPKDAVPRSRLTKQPAASAYLTSASFSSYSFTKEAPARASPTPSNDSQDMEDEAPYCVFGVSLSTILECLNIFGNAGSSGGGKEWGGKGGEESGGRGRRRDEAELESKDDGKVTSLRMTYAGDGEPLVLLWVADPIACALP